MDTHPITTWYQLVHATLHPAVLIESAPETLDEYLATAYELKEALIMQLMHDTFYNKTEAETGLLVERYQTICGNLLDQLFDYQFYEVTNELIEFYKAVGTQLESIIAMLQDSYGRYFNANLIPPYSLRLREERALQRLWKNTARTLGESESNIPIVNILDYCINKMLHDDNETAVTYQQAAYLQNLLKELSSYVFRRSYEPGPDSLTELLIGWNFNEFAFIHEVCTSIRREVENKESDECRLEYLKNTQKQMSQVLEKTNAAFHLTRPSAKQTVLEWIAQELTCLEEPAIVQEKKEVKEGIKINTSVSVPVLALITRLLKESGIVTNSNQTEIVKFFATHFTTPHKSELSYGHLRGKYYDTDEGTKKKVCDYLTAMTNLCKKL
jgi:hypothetical protein